MMIGAAGGCTRCHHLLEALRTYVTVQQYKPQALFTLLVQFIILTTVHSPTSLSVPFFTPGSSTHILHYTKFFCKFLTFVVSEFLHAPTPINNQPPAIHASLSLSLCLCLSLSSAEELQYSAFLMHFENILTLSNVKYKVVQI